MNAKTDRRLIAPLLREHFPHMRAATSAEWHGFLNHVTGLDLAPDEPNATAFDAWRKALARVGYPVWHYTADDVAAMKERGRELAQAEAERRQQTVEPIAAERRRRMFRRG